VMRIFTPDVIVQDFTQLVFSKKQASLWAE